jgi:predicted SprT family Zn-dependent metalloprotease
VRLGRRVVGKEQHQAALLAAAGLQDEETRTLAEQYLRELKLEDERLFITTDRRAFEQMLGRRVDAAIGGGYVFHARKRTHLVLINLPRIDRSRPRALEVVVAEELLHMRDWIDGDRRRHAKHGYDRIAHRVSALTGVSLEEIRSCLLPRTRRPVRYLYRCPGCDRIVERRRRGTWSCGRCAPGFDQRFVLLLERDLKYDVKVAEPGDLSRQ